MNRLHWWAVPALLATLVLSFTGCEKDDDEDDDGGGPAAQTDPVVADATTMITQGRDTFRDDTFGSEGFWGDTLRLHQAIAGEANGGVGPGVSPATALGPLGLKVDAERVPAAVASQLRANTLDLNNPANTVELLRANSVIGVKGFFDTQGRLNAVGITCALCHSTVDDSFAPGIGRRLDGWPNRDLNVGEIIASAPDLTAVARSLGLHTAEGVAPAATQDAIRTEVRTWGRGMFDAELNLDAKISSAGGRPTAIPAAFGLSGVNLHTYTGWGSVTYWNAFVANLEMGGIGTFFDPRLADTTKFPRATANGFVDRRPPAGQADRITPKLADLHFYQLALRAPKPAAGTFDAAAAERGRAVFNDKARCATCHVPPLFTEPGWNMHTPAEIGLGGDAAATTQASRSPDGRFRTTPLGGLHTRVSKSGNGGWYHDARFKTLEAVVDHYTSNGVGNGGTAIALTPSERADLVEYLKSL